MDRLSGGRGRRNRLGQAAVFLYKGDGGRVVAYLVSFGSDRVGRVFHDKLVRYIGWKIFVSPSQMN